MTIKHPSYLTPLMLFATLMAHSAQLRVPQPDVPGLLIPDDAIPLAQTDFQSGSYRIKKPGYYYFVEDVFFNPNPVLEAKRADKPLIGAWFAALSIECDNVVIDLNTKTFATARAFLESQKLKVFALIEFGNSPFPLQKFPFFAYTGETEPIFANNVVVKNGTVGASPHHGLHGNSNSNIQIHDIVVRDWEVAGIAFNGLKSGTIRNITITGLEHPMDFTGLVSVMLAVKVVLEDLRDKHGDQNAQAYINALQPLIDDPTMNGSIHPTRLNYGNVYGIFLNRAFDIGPVAQVVNDQNCNAIIIEDVLIANITSQLLETVAIANLQGQTMMAELFGTFRWEDAYPNGVFAPNALLKAQVYAQQQRAPQKMPAGFAENILSAAPQESLFLAAVQPIFGLDFPGHANKGIFGIRVDAGYGVTIKNCSIMGLNNRGLPGKGLGDIPGGDNYEASQRYTAGSAPLTIARYAGNDVYGISLSVCRNCSVIECDVSECASDNGNVHGIMIRNGTDATMVNGAVISNLRASRDDEMSTINPSSHVSGITVDSNAAANTIQNSRVQTLTAPRYVCGICAGKATDTLITGNLVSHLSATASPSSDGQKQVIAYASLLSRATHIEQCMARALEAAGEGAFNGKSASITAGYLLGGEDNYQPDSGTVVTASLAEALNGGAGVAAGVFIANAEQVAITDNTFTYSTTFGVQSQGYGIYNAGGTSTTGFVLSNTAYGNSFKNYEPLGVTWPIVTVATTGRNQTAYQAGWVNFSLT